jgi:hypothetical protein
MTEPEIVGLIAIGLMNQKDRDKRDPSRYFGHENEVSSLKADPKAAVIAIVEKYWPEVQWNGELPLMVALADRLEQICNRERGLAHMNLVSRHLESARKILANHRANGGISLSVVLEAEAIIAEHGPMKLASVPAIEGAAT